jgi:hypothetical protein
MSEKPLVVDIPARLDRISGTKPGANKVGHGDRDDTKIDIKEKP